VPLATVEDPGLVVPTIARALDRRLDAGRAVVRAGWPVQGTTGYETLNDIESIFIHYDGACAVERTYRQFRRIAGGREVTFQSVAREGRLKVLRGALRADVRRLARLLAPVLREERGKTTAAGNAPSPSSLLFPP
jgi:(1->4)-alpha-D-glucan 1-alpha-D-glucosylmutase